MFSAHHPAAWHRSLASASGVQDLLKFLPKHGHRAHNGKSAA